MDKVVDARGLPCPKPVMLVSEAMESAADITVIVDNAPAKENVSRLAAGRGFAVSAEQRPDGIYLRLLKRSAPTAPQDGPVASGTVLFIGSDMVGRGDNAELGRLLMQSFLNTLGGLRERPETIVFMNSGVVLVTEGSPVLGELKQLAEQGVELLACGTCLSRLGLIDKLAVGKVSNMYTLAETMLRAQKVLTL